MPVYVRTHSVQRIKKKNTLCIKEFFKVRDSSTQKLAIAGCTIIYLFFFKEYLLISVTKK